MIREAKFAGRFYPEQASNLRNLIAECFASNIGPQILPSDVKTGLKPVYALICPHAGYVYSGPVAAWAYLEASKNPIMPDTVLLLGPNHTGLGSKKAVYPNGQWRTPLGTIGINEQMSRKIADKGFDLDTQAHEFEHSIEVQLPFLQTICKSDFQIVCISLMNQSIEVVKKLSQSLAEVIKDEKVLIVSTTDLSHYLPDDIARQNDKQLLDSFVGNNIELVYSQSEELHTSACGITPVAMAIQTCSNLGSQKVNLLKYETSAATSGDTSSVVGYAALSIH